MPTATASAKLLDPVLQIARHNRLDLHGLLSAVQLEQVEKDKPGARIPAATFCLLLEELGQRSNNDRIALRIGEATQPRMLGSVGFLMTTATDLRASYQVLIDYLPLLFEGIHLQMEQHADETELILELENADQRKTIEWFMACLLNWPRWISGKQIPALLLELAFQAPEDTQAYQRFFATEISYNADRNRLLIPSSYLKLPCLEANEEMHRMHMEFADSLLSISGREGALVAQIKSLIRQALTDAQGSIRREKIAASLNLSLRTLQRKLGNLNTSFQELYDQTRKELALQQIQKGAVSFGELSFLLGFSNQSAFQKAFKRWTGTPPSLYRQQIMPKAFIAQDVNPPRTLAALIPENGFSLERFFGPALQLTALLEQLHLQGNLAGDLCPNHIAVELAGSEPELSLIDPSPLVPIQPLERLYYLAPEKIGLVAANIDFRADFYALGCIFYEMLSGKPPFSDKDPALLLRAHLNASIKQLSNLPEALQAIVQQLLNKSPEQRYQSSHGLYTDLLASRKLIEQELTANQTPFKTARDDRPDKLVFPNTLYGRELPIKQLQTALGQARTGKGRLVLISGPEGIGKSSLVYQLRSKLIKDGASFISGHCERQRQRPYGVFIRAIQQLLFQKMAGPQPQLQRWKQRLRQQLGNDFELLLGLITDLQLLFDRKTTSSPSDPVEQEARTASALLKLLRASTDHPLVLFLDDAQWIDTPSLTLLKTLLKQRITHLLILVAFRDAPSDSPSPLSAELASLTQQQNCESLRLAPLSTEDSRRLVADVFHHQGSEPIALAGWLHRKTQGNPFYLRRYLQQLHQNRWIYFDQQLQCWSWQQHAFENQALTEEIRELVEFQISGLPKLTQDILSWAAVIGNRFDLATLSKASGQPQARIAIHLWSALHGGLIISQADQQSSANSYRFLHDHIRQSAYHRLDPSERQRIHLNVGQMLLRHYSREERGTAIYDLVNHLNQAHELFNSDDQRLELIQLNIKAAVKAADASAFKPACGFLRQGAALLLDSDWQQHYRQRVELLLLLAKMEYLSGSDDQAQALYRQMADHFNETHDLARLMHLQSEHHLHSGNIERARETLTQGLDYLGLATAHGRASLFKQLEQIQGLPQDNLSLDRLPTRSTQHPVALALLQLLSQIDERCGDPVASGSALASMVSLCLQHKPGPERPLTLAAYAHLSQWLWGDNRLAAGLLQQGLSLCDTSQDRMVVAKCRLLGGAKVVHWHAHVRDSLNLLESSRELALETGDWGTAAQALLVNGNNLWLCGLPLTELQGPYQDFQRLLQQIGDAHAVREFSSSAVYVLTQLSQEQSTSLLPGPPHNDEPAEPGWHFPARLLVSYLLSQPQDWTQLIAQEAILERHFNGYFVATEALFILALMRLELCRDASPEQQNQLLKAVTLTEAQLEHWSQDCPQNFAHRLALISALKAQMLKQPDSAMALFEQAIGGAEAQGFLYHQAIANEHYGRFWMDRGQQRVGDYFTSAAVTLYQRWGAPQKAKKLAEFSGTSR